MRFRAVLGALAGAAVVVSLASAQDAPPPPVFQVTTLELSPATMMAWRSALAKQAAAAKAAKLPAQEVGWWALNDGNRTMIVRLHSRDELFSNTQGQMIQKLRAADSAGMAAIQAEFQRAQINSVTNEIIQAAPNLSYEPATPIPDSAFGGIVTVEYHIAPGQGQAFNEAIRALNKGLADLKYPYARRLYRVRMGEGRTQVITFIDNREAYFGKNSIGRLMQSNQAAREALMAGYQALLKTVTSMQTSMASYAANQSYPPGM